jgi:hypothetical protein
MSEPFVGAKRKPSACHCDLNAEASASSTVAPSAGSGKDGQTGNCGDEIAEGEELECAECRAQFLSLKDLKRHKARQQRIFNFILLAVNSKSSVKFSFGGEGGETSVIFQFFFLIVGDRNGANLFPVGALL